MPDELELNREGRTQLAELMLEYPTKPEEQEKKQVWRGIADTTHAFDVKAIQNANCADEPPQTFTGAHPRAEKEEFANRCKARRRNSKGPAELREHTQYICTLLTSSTQDKDNAHQAQANRETEQAREQLETEEGKPTMETQDERHTMGNAREDNEHARRPGKPRQPRESRERTSW